MNRLSCDEVDLAIHVSDEPGGRAGKFCGPPTGCQSNRSRARSNFTTRTSRTNWLNMELECEKSKIETLAADRTLQCENSIKQSLGHCRNVPLEEMLSKHRREASS
jgi:hypothetical protein